MRCIMSRIIQRDMITNKIVHTFDDIEECCKVLGLPYIRVYQQLRRNKNLKRPQLPYYLQYEGEEPIEHKVYDCYDEDFELLFTAWNIDQLSKRSGICYKAVLSHLKNNRGVELRNRKMPPQSGLYLTERIV